LSEEFPETSKPRARRPARNPAGSESSSAPPAPPSAALAQRPAPDAPLRTLLGLLVVWAGLFLVFMAHYISDTRIELSLPVVEGLRQEQSIESLLEPRAVLLLSYKMHARGISPREALANLAASASFTIDRTKLRDLGLGDRPDDIHFDDLPLYQAVHQLLGDPSRGFALIGRNLIVFAQSLEIEGARDSGLRLDWKAELPLTRQRMLVVPSERSNVWFSIHLTGDPTSTLEDLNSVQVEVWKGSEWLTMAKADLDDAGNAQLSLATVDRIALSIQTRRPPIRNDAGLYALNFFFQSFD
jgi:hypothetical protein